MSDNVICSSVPKTLEIRRDAPRLDTPRLDTPRLACPIRAVKRLDPKQPRYRGDSDELGGKVMCCFLSHCQASLLHDSCKKSSQAQVQMQVLAGYFKRRQGKGSEGVNCKGKGA